MKIEECFEKGLLKKDIKDINKAKKSIEIAKHKTEISKKVFDIKIFEDSIVNAYAAMFHAARALLYKDGIKERSHYGLFVYVKEKYKDKLEPRFINELNALRLERHELLYGLEKTEIKEVEAEGAIKIAEDFINAVEKLPSLNGVQKNGKNPKSIDHSRL